MTKHHLEPCSAADEHFGRRLQCLMIEAPPPICWRAVDATLMCLIVLLYFSSFAKFRYKLLSQCEVEVNISRQQFVLKSGFWFLEDKFLKKLCPNIAQKVKKIRSTRILLLWFQSYRNICDDHHRSVIRDSRSQTTFKNAYKSFLLDLY